MIISGSRWYVVQTHVHAEAKAVAHLERQYYSICLPRYLERRRHTHRVENIAALLFPRRMADRKRVAILLDLLGRQVRVVLDAESVAAA